MKAARNIFGNTKFHVLEGKLQETWGNECFLPVKRKVLRNVWSFYKMAMFFSVLVFRSCFVNLEVNRENDGGEGERARERRQKATYNNLSHPSQFLVHFFFCRHCTITTYFFSLSEISSRGVWLHFRQIDSFNNGDKTEVEKNAKTLFEIWTFSLHGSFPS